MYVRMELPVKDTWYLFSSSPEYREPVPRAFQAFLQINLFTQIRTTSADLCPPSTCLGPMDLPAVQNPAEDEQCS